MDYKLQYNNYTAQCTTRGGELFSFCRGDIEYIWQGNPQFWTGRSPHLFPVVCSPKAGCVTYNGITYEMPKHGFIRDADFHVVELSPSYVVIENKWNEATMKMFPYKYCLHITHRLFDGGFQTEYEVSSDYDDMIFCIGGHPGFNCPILSDESFEQYKIEFDDASGAVMSYTENGYMDSSLPRLDRIHDNVLNLKYSDFDQDAMIIENLPVKKLNLISSVTGHGIRFEFDGFDALGIWTPVNANAPFVCLEPWNGLPASVDESTDAENKKYAVKLSKGNTYTVGYRVSVI